MVHHALLFIPVLVLGQAAQASPCDPDLAGRGRGTVFAYRERGERCEGLYNSPVGGDILALVSLTEAFGDYDAASGEPLIVQWSGVGDGTLRLRAEGVRSELYYRMDTARPAASGAFAWPTDFLASRGIPRQDVAVRGWVSRSFGGIDTRVYVPLRIAQRGRNPECGPLRFLLWPGVRLNRVTVSVRRLSDSGEPGAWIKRDEDLDEPFYPAETVIEVVLPGLAPGTYWVRFVAVPRVGSPAPAEYYVQRSAPPAGCPR